MKVMILDDHHLFASMIQISLVDFASEIEVFSKREELEIALGNTIPDILLLDINLGGENGLAIGKQLLLKYDSLRIAFLSGYDLPEYHNQAFQLGAVGFLNKKISIQELKSALTKIGNGGTIFPKIEPGFENLTSREREVLQLVAQGFSQEEISHELNISKRTVTTQLQKVREKLNVTTTNGAISRGMEKGIISLPVYF